VLPFVNMSGGPEQDYFADGVVEEIITALSRVRWFFVIARNSSFTYKGRAVDIKRVGQELGVRYVLEGSVRRAGNRMRIIAQLIEAENNAHIWAERYDGTVEDVFDLQDRITESVVTAIEPQIRTAELERTRRKRPDNLTAYDCFLRGMAHFWMTGFESAENTLGLFRRAIDNDPGFAQPYALAAQCYVYRVSQGVSRDVAEEAAEGARMARAAIERDPNDPTVLALAAHALGHLTNEYDNALTLMERALALHPNSAIAWQLAGWMRNWVGEPVAALDRFHHGQRLSPLDMRSFIVHSGMATAHIMLGEYEKAIECARKSISEGPHWHTGYRMLAAALAGTGQLEEARAAAAHQLKINPGYNLRLVRVIFKPSPGRDLLIDGLRKAGIPD
jgi:adenylate cyclase